MFWFFGRQTKECKLRWIGWRLQPLVHPKTLTLLRLPRNLPLALLRSPHQSLRCSNPSYSSRHRAAPPLKLRVPGSVGFADCAKSNRQADARFPIPSTNVGKTGGSQSGKRCLRSWNGQVGIRTGVLTWSFIVVSFPLKVFFSFITRMGIVDLELGECSCFFCRISLSPGSPRQFKRKMCCPRKRSVGGSQKKWWLLPWTGPRF